MLETLDVTAIQLDRNVGFAAGCNAAGGPGQASMCCSSTPTPGSIRLPSSGSPASSTQTQASASPRRGSSSPTARSTSRSAASRGSAPRMRTRSSSTASFAELRGQASSSRTRAPMTGQAAPNGRRVRACSCAGLSSNSCAGWDDGFFMYCEDKDLCRRARDQGYDVRFEPARSCCTRAARRHRAPASSSTLAASRVRYARKHEPSAARGAGAPGIALTALTHAIAGRGGRAARAGHARALRAALRTAHVA